MPTPLISGLIVTAGLMGLSGCATKEFVLEEAGKVDRRVAALEQALATAHAQGQHRLKQHESRMDATDATLTETRNQLQTRGQQVDGLAQGFDANKQTLTAHAQRLQGTEKGLQMVQHDLSSVQSQSQTQAQSLGRRVDLTDATLAETRNQLQARGQQVDGLAQGLDANKQTLTEHAQRLQGTEKGLQMVQHDLSSARSQSQTQAQSLGQRVDEVNSGIAQQGKKVDSLLIGLDASKQTLTDHAQRLHQTEAQARVAAGERAHIAATAQEALTRANAAGKLAEGKLMYASVLNQDLSGFKLNQAVLGEAAKAALKAFAEKLKSENANVYLEIQGHTDTSGHTETNRLLSLRRAEAVRDFLYTEGGIALHRMAVFAYGGSHPMADNKQRQGREQNRRVLIVVLK